MVAQRVKIGTAVASIVQKQLQNANNPFAQVWVESGQVDPATNRFNSGVTYDDAGNVTVDSKFRNLAFQYDANNRQKQSSATDGSGAVVSIYDAGGQRVATQVNGAVTNVLVYDAGGKLVAEYGSAPPEANGTQYVTADHQGSPRAITNSSGAVVSRHDYAPFGEDLPANIGLRTPGQGYSQPDAVRQKYAGMETDDASGMSHTLWRQYDNLSARWTAPDPYAGSMSIAAPQSFNRYTYVENDPVNKTDPSGLMTMVDASMNYGEVSGMWAGGSFGGPETGRSIINNGMSGFPDRTEEVSYCEEGDCDSQGEAQQRRDPSVLTGTVSDPSAEGTNGNPEDERIDSTIAGLVTDGGIVRGVSSSRNQPGRNSHNQLEDGTVHTFHAYADAAATKRTAVYSPPGFTQIERVGASTVLATNPVTHQVLEYSHILRTKRRPNKDGSTYIGLLGGPGADRPGNRHAHVTLFANRESRHKVFEWRMQPTRVIIANTPGFPRNIDMSQRMHVRDIRSIFRRP